MQFTSFLRSTVMACAASATLLATVAVAGANQVGDGLVIPIAAGWWGMAAGTGIFLGRHGSASPAISRLLSQAQATTTLPETGGTRILFNRLWPLLVATVGAGGCVFLAPQIPAMAAGFPIIWALTWRRQERAVKAVEERDGAKFFIERTSPLKPIRLVRTPWFQSGRNGVGGGDSYTRVEDSDERN